MMNITLLGATGSIGQSTLSLIRTHPDRFNLYALSAHKKIDELIKLCVEFKPRFVVTGDEHGARQCREALARHAPPVEVLSGA